MISILHFVEILSKENIGILPRDSFHDITYELIYFKVLSDWNLLSKKISFLFFFYRVSSLIEIFHCICFIGINIQTSDDLPFSRYFLYYWEILSKKRIREDAKECTRAVHRSRPAWLILFECWALGALTMALLRVNQKSERL